MYCGVSYYVARHYLACLADGERELPREAVGMLRYDPGFDDKILPVYM